MSILTRWLRLTPPPDVTAATRAWLDIDGDAREEQSARERLLEWQVQAGQAEHELRARNREYGRASHTIGMERMQNAFLRARITLLRSELAEWRRVHGTARPVDEQRGADEPLAAAIARHPAGSGLRDQTAAIEGAAITLRAHVYSPVHRDTACSCGWDAVQGNYSHTPPYGEAREAAHARHVAEQLAPVGALGNHSLSVKSSLPTPHLLAGDKVRVRLFGDLDAGWSTAAVVEADDGDLVVEAPVLHVEPELRPTPRTGSFANGGTSKLADGTS